MNKKTRGDFLILFSLFLGLIFDAFPMYSSLNEVKPTILLLTLIYWNIALPDRVGITISLLFGLLMDLLEGTFLGIYPLVFVISSFLSQRFFYQFRVRKIWQQSLIIFLLAFTLKLLLSFDFIDVQPNLISLSDNLYLGSSLIYALLSSFLWPFIFFSLRYYRRKWISV